MGGGEGKLRCGIKCPHWYFSLRLREGPVCRKHSLPLFAAWDKCFTVAGPGRARKRRLAVKQPAVRKTHVAARDWPGIARGYGAITRKHEGEL